MFQVIDKSRWQLLQQRVFEKRIAEAVIFLRQNGIEPILIKGWLTAQLYPDPAARSCADIDLIVSPTDFNFANDCLENYPDKYMIDLHKGAKSLDTLSYTDLYNNSKTTLCDDTEIRVVCAEDHLRILCVHWLISGGDRKDRLWDIYYAVANRSPDFDWDKCLNVVSKTRRKWIICAIGLTKKYLGLNLSNTPIAREVDDIPGWLIESVEKEWQSEVLLISLEHCLKSKKIFWQQIKRRIPPNSIQATIDMEGKFDDRPRIFYQIGNVFQRLPSSIRRIAGKLIFKT